MKTKTILKIASAICTLFLVLSFTACSKSTSDEQTDSKLTSEQTESVSETKADENSIIGSWEYTGGTYIYTFNEDGTGTYDVGSDNPMKFTYELSETELSILYDGNTAPTVLEYVLDGDTLNVKDSFGEDTIYKRK